MISAWPQDLFIFSSSQPRGLFKDTTHRASLSVCLCSRGYSTGAHTESLDSQCEAHTASSPGPPVLLWPHTDSSTLPLPPAPQSLFADLLLLLSSTRGPDLSWSLPLPLHRQLPPSLSPELWVQTPCHNKGYCGCAQPCSLPPQTRTLGKMPCFFLVSTPKQTNKTHLNKRRHISVISAVRRLRKEDAYEFKAILGHSGNHFKTKTTDNHLRQGKSAPVLCSLCSSIYVFILQSPNSCPVSPEQAPSTHYPPVPAL